MKRESPEGDAQLDAQRDAQMESPERLLELAHVLDMNLSSPSSPDMSFDSELLISSALRLAWPKDRQKGVSMEEAATSCMDAAAFLELAAQHLRQSTTDLDTNVASSQESSQEECVNNYVNCMANLAEFSDDVRVSAGGCEMWAPAIVLAATSPALKAMLSSPTQEGRTKSIVVETGDASSAAVEAWLTFITTGELQAEEEILADVANLADKYDMPELLAVAVSRMGESVNPITAAVFLRTLLALPQSTDIASACAKLSKVVPKAQVKDKRASRPAAKSTAKRNKTAAEACPKAPSRVRVPALGPKLTAKLPSLG